MRTKDDVLKDMGPLRAELDNIDTAERKREHKKLLGKCYKYRNSYGGEPSWWLYARVYGSDGWRPMAFKFETTSRDLIEIDGQYSAHICQGSTWNEISSREFNAAWRKVQQRIAKVKFK